MPSNNEPNRDAPSEPPDPMDFVETHTTTPDGGRRTELVTYPEHPLFPLDDGVPETRDIQFVTFRRRRSDGRIDNCPEDVRADKVTSWAEVVGPWGGGEYKAIGKDKNHRIVAWYPPEKGSWLLFDQPSKPFTLRDEAAYGRPLDPPAPPPPAVAPGPSHTDAMMLAMFNQAAETNRTILEAALKGNNKESNSWELVRVLKEMQPNPLDWLRAVREMMPAPAAAPPAAPQLSLPEQLNTVKTLLDWTRPPPATPEPSLLGELGGLVTTVIQNDAAARAATRSPDPPERRAPPPRNPRLFHVPGLGVVDLLQPEPTLPPGLPAPVRPPLPSAAEPAAQPQSPALRVDAAPKPAPAGIVMAPSAAQATRGAGDTRGSGRDQLAAPEVAAAPSDSVGELIESLKRDPVALGRLLHALGVPPPNTVVSVAQLHATQAHHPVSDRDVGDPHVVADVPVRSAPIATEPASPVGALRPRLVRDETPPPAAAPEPARETRLPAPPPGARTPASHAVAADTPVRGTDGGSAGPDAGSEAELSSVAQVRAVSPKATPRDAQAQVSPPESAGAQAGAPQASTAYQRVIELPEQMPEPPQGTTTTTTEDAWPPVPGSELSAAEREQAANTLATVPRDKLVAHLKGIPGLAPFADDMMKAVADLPPEAIPILVGRLPPDDARALAAMIKNRKGG